MTTMFRRTTVAAAAVTVAVAAALVAVVAPSGATAAPPTAGPATAGPATAAGSVAAGPVVLPIEPPRHVQVAPVGPHNGQAKVLWNPPAVNDGSTYLIYHDRPDGNWWFVGSTTHSSEYPVSGHNAGAAGLCYRVQRLWNGQYSNVSAHGCGSVWGPQQLPAPGQVTVVSLAPDRLYVSWVRPQPNDGSTYEVHQYDNLRWIRKAVVGDVYSTHITGLDRGVRYCFNVVRIKNGVRSGWSPGGCGVPTS